jgi:hemoglobin
VAGVLVFVLNEPFWAQDKKSGEMKMGGGAAKALDKAVYKSLHDVINHGADLFNINGDYAGCYRAYEAGLIAVKPFLAHRPDVQKTIDDGLAEAARKHRVIDRAFALRKVLADVRIAVRADVTPPVKDKKDKAATDKKVTKEKAGKEKKETDKKVETKSLWDRLGGEANVAKVVRDFVKIAADNPKVNLTRNGKYKLDDKTVKLLEKHVVAFVSSATGGPLKYKGPNMKEAHKGMDITNSEFNAAKADLKIALEKNGAKATEIKELLQIVEGTRKDIVEVKKKTTDKKETDKKATDKKDTDKKATDKKDTDKKSTDKKADTPKEKAGTVSGTVMLDGRPAAGAGYLTLVSADKQTFATFIHKDGAYFFRGPIPAGEYTIMIEKGPKEAGEDPVPVPERYRSATTSGLSFAVSTGNQQRDLNLLK